MVWNSIAPDCFNQLLTFDKLDFKHASKIETNT